MRPLTGTWRARPAARNVRLPAVLCFDANPDETLEALSRIRRRLLIRMTGTRVGRSKSKHRGARVGSAPPYFRFEDFREIGPSAAVVLAAEFERSGRLAGTLNPTIVNVDAWRPEVLDTLWDIGFFDIVGFPTGVGKPDLGRDQVVLPMRSGDTADPASVSETVDNLRSLYPDRQQGDDGLVHLYGAMIEAVVNVIRHAYPQDAKFQFRHIGRWWMTGAVDRQERRTTAVIYDQGVSIPVSLPNWRRYADWTNRFRAVFGMVPSVDDTNSDGSAIAIALEEAVSSTEDPHRGHGLAQMRQFVTGCSEGYLRVMSRCGEVIFYANGAQRVSTRAISVGGTLIEWHVLL